MPSLRAAEEPTPQELAERMLTLGPKFDPQPLLDQKVAGMRAVVDAVFPEITDDKERAAKIAALIEQLGDESFQKRDAASAALGRLGSIANDALQQALEHKDPEVRSRSRKLLDEIKNAPASNQPVRYTLPSEKQKFYPGLQAYLLKLKDVESQQEFARGVCKALAARLDKTPKQELLKLCLENLAYWPEDKVHDELLPLLKLEDPEPALFAMKYLNAHSNVRYVPSIYEAALNSDRMVFVKKGFRAQERNAKSRAKALSILKQMYDESPEYAELRKEPEFLWSASYNGARFFSLPQSRAWFYDKIKNGEEKDALKAMMYLGDAHYTNHPLDPKLYEALEPHLQSENVKLRAAAVRTLGAYQGELVYPALLKAFADPTKEVWQNAGDRMHTLYSFGPRTSPIPELLKKELEITKDAKHKERIEVLLNHVQPKKVGGFVKWPEQ